MLAQEISREAMSRNASFPEHLLQAAAHPDPYPYYAALLAYRPIYREEKIGLWVALGADEAAAVLDSPLCRVRPPVEPVPANIAGSSAGNVFGHLVRMNDGDRHRVLKPAVAATIGAFDPGALIGAARRIAAACLEESGAGASGIDRFARAFPVRAIAEMIGLPAKAAPMAAALIADFTRCLSPLSSPAQIESSKSAAARLLHLLEEQSDGKQRGGVPMQMDRLMSLGVAQREAALANLLGLMSQTYEATAGLIGNTLLALARDTDLQRRAAGDDALLHRIVGEVLRHDPPVHNTRRFVAEDGIVAGQEMKAGDTILVVLAAANRDPALHARPHLFDPDRADQSCFTFGHGRHACPGAAIAMELAAIGVQALMARGAAFDDLLRAVRYAASVNARIPIFGEPA
ncbi:MAG TPA: cytochrome P450 [Dongiaceae bacterium]|nr:cytochrome P450 [Dongiaceae bacterium]